MSSMSIDPGAQDGAVPSEEASDSDGTAMATPSAPHEQTFEEALAHLAATTEEWQQARDALLRG
jgi:hypothetical protein